MGLSCFPLAQPAPGAVELPEAARAEQGLHHAECGTRPALGLPGIQFSTGMLG